MTAKYHWQAFSRGLPTRLTAAQCYAGDSGGAGVWNLHTECASSALLEWGCAMERGCQARELIYIQEACLGV